MTKNVTWGCLFAGGVGGTAPHLVRIGQNLLGDHPPPPLSPTGYGLGLLVFALLGGFLVWILEENVRKKAFFVGLSMPAIIQVSLLQGAAQRGLSSSQSGLAETSNAMAREAAIHPAGALFLNLAFADAQEPELPSHPQDEPPRSGADSASAAPEAIRAPGHERELRIVLDDLPKGTEFFVIAEGEEGLKRLDVRKPGFDREVTVALPADADALVLRSGVVQSPPIRLSGTSEANLHITTDETFWGGFLRSVGVQDAPTFVFKAEWSEAKAGAGG